MSYALHPSRSVASKNGDRRYHGPKNSVVLPGIVVVLVPTFVPLWEFGLEGEL